MPDHEDEHLARGQKCEYCGAKPGEPCVSVGAASRPAIRKIHAKRWDALRATGWRPGEGETGVPAFDPHNPHPLEKIRNLAGRLATPQRLVPTWRTWPD